MTIRIPSRISPREAIALQKKLAPLVRVPGELPENLTRLVGCDATYFDETTLAAAALLNYEDLKLLRVKSVKERTRFPYIPGLLAFREAPAVLRAIRSLNAGKSYVCLVDAHGLAHPRRFGLACFIGIALDRPTIGVAKSLLYGNVKGNEVRDANGGQIGEVLELPGSTRRIYVSVGHKISLKDAVEIVKHTLSAHGPVPIRCAHESVTNEKWKLRKSMKMTAIPNT